MSDRRDELLKRDFDALFKATNKEMRPLRNFVQEGANSRRKAKEDNAMFFSSLSNKRPLLIAPVAVVAVAAVLFLIPVSYNRTVGWDVSLAVTASSLSPEQLRPVATELKSALGVEGVRVELEQGQNGSRATMSAYVDAEKNPNPGATMQAFAKYLNGKGLVASAESKPKVTEVSSNVWAMTVDHVIRVEIEGKSDEEVEEEIIARLKEVGLDEVEVDVSRDGDEKTRIEIKAECGQEQDSDCPLDPVKLTLTKNGVEPSGDGEDAFIRVRKMIKDGEEIFSIDLGFEGKKATIELADPASMEAEELVEAVQAQLIEQEVSFPVKVEEGTLWVGTLRIDCIEIGK